MRISDWSSDLCSSDLHDQVTDGQAPCAARPTYWPQAQLRARAGGGRAGRAPALGCCRLADRLTFSDHHQAPFRARTADRQRVVEGKGVSVRVDLGGRRIIKKKNNKHKDTIKQT